MPLHEFLGEIALSISLGSSITNSQAHHPFTDSCVQSLSHSPPHTHTHTLSLFF